MKKTSKSQERNREQSISGNDTCILTSILKKPSKFKLKHQRSVRFEEPETSCPTTFSLTSSINETQFTSPVNNNPLSISPSKSRLSSTSPVKINSKGHSQFSRSLKESFNPTPVKIIKISKIDSKDFRDSPKSGQKVLKLDCRDEKFYNKLNFFLNAKSSVSPVRCGEVDGEGNVRVSKKKINFKVNRLYEDTANWKVNTVNPEKKGNVSKGGRSVKGKYLLN